MTFFFSEPPPDLPILTINGISFNGTDSSNVREVEEGTIANISCEVSGGFPNETTETIQCAGIPISNNSLFITRNLTFENCSCSGELHPSGCYDKNTTVQLIVICEL